MCTYIRNSVQKMKVYSSLMGMSWLMLAWCTQMLASSLCAQIICKKKIVFVFSKMKLTTSQHMLQEMHILKVILMCVSGLSAIWICRVTVCQ